MLQLYPAGLENGFEKT